MDMTRSEADRRCTQAVEAMRQRRPDAALQHIEPLAITPFAPWLLLAQVRAAAGDSDGAERAADHLLSSEPRNIGALIVKGDCRALAKDSRAATAFYNAALATAAHSEKLPVGLQSTLQRVAAVVEGYSRDYESSLRTALDRAGLSTSPRLAEALDIVTGRRRIHLQEPVSFYYPGLPQTPFYERSSFEWAAMIEAETAAIREELLTIVEDDVAFRPYVESDPDRPAKQGNAMLGDPRWGAFYLWRNGAPVAEHADRFPRTLAALDMAPMPRVAGRSPMALFSRLKPGMHILPHHGFLNTRLICHLPLITSAGCRLRVGNEERTWREGELMIFDDSFEHEAWNDGTDTRTVLLFEIWRPEIGADDRAALSLLFEHISGYSDAEE